MSFILDALRKSEHERQRQTGPALVETPVAAPKPKSNVWATAAIALLVINLVAIGLLLLYKSQEVPVAATNHDAPRPAQPDPTPAKVPPTAQAAVTRTLPPPVVAPPPPMLRPAEAASATPGTRNPLEGEVSGDATSMDQEAALRAAEPPAGPPAVVPTRRGSVVYESLPDTDPGINPVPGSQRPSATANLPTADEFAARAGLPEMRLELHVYSTDPQQRFAFINGRKYQQGDSTQEGATVEEITADGVILAARGNRFLLPRD